MERIGNLREEVDDGGRTDAPPAPLIQSPWLRRMFGMRTLAEREERLRSQVQVDLVHLHLDVLPP